MSTNPLLNKFDQIEKKIDQEQTNSFERSVTPTIQNPEIQKLTQKKHALSLEVNELIAGEHDLENNPEYIKHYINELKIDIKKLEQKKKKLKRAIPFFFSSQLKSLKKKQKELLDKKSDLKKIVQLLEKDLKNQTSQVSVTKTKSNDIHFELEVLQEKKTNLIREKENYANTFVRLKEELALAEEKTLNLRREISNLEKTNKLLTENTLVLKSKRDSVETSYLHLNSLKNTKIASTKTKQEETEKNTTSKRSPISFDLQPITTEKLDHILEDYKANYEVKVKAHNTELNTQDLRELYQNDMNGFNLIVHLRSKLSLLLDQYDFEDTGVFQANYFETENLATLDLKNISIERNVLDSFFKKILQDKRFKKYKSPSRIYRYTANGLVKELRFKLNLVEDNSQIKIQKTNQITI